MLYAEEGDMKMEVLGMISAGVQLMDLAVFGVTDADWPQYQHELPDGYIPRRHAQIL